MKLVLSWLKEFVDIDCSLEELARTMTMIGLEVEEIQLIGLPKPQDERLENVYAGLEWEKDKVVVAEVTEVMPHPNADRLVLCKLNDGNSESIVLTGAPNLYEFKGKGPLPNSLKVAYAREGTTLYDGHQPGRVLTTLKRMKIRGVESSSMICSEKELGISDEHEGVIILDNDAPVGTPLVDYMGDAVFQVAILPNMVRDACMLGAAREIAAAFNKSLRLPSPKLRGEGPTIEGAVKIEITDPTLNPRFVFGMARAATAQPSPYWVQRRLRLAGMRPINSTVDATNYVMLEVGEPLHAFDYDILKKRANGKSPTIITRAAQEGETLTTLDDVDRKLDEFTILVTDTAGPLALAGVMGGLESEITASTSNILLEGASWNFINTRRTVAAQKLQSEAGYRFSRNIHPALAKYAVELCLSRIAEWSGGSIASGLVDEYPLPYIDPILEITPADVEHSIGISLSPQEIADLLTRLDFTCTVKGKGITVKSPDHRTDIGEGVIGKADLMEEIARLYGYDRIPSNRMEDLLPPQRTNSVDDFDRKVKNTLTGMGLQEIINYRLTSPEEEQRILPDPNGEDEKTYVQILNPISQDKRVMRSELTPQMLVILEHNIRHSDRLGLFEIGPVFISLGEKQLPKEEYHLCIGLSGLEQNKAWDRKAPNAVDFYDMKGYVEMFLETLHIENIKFSPHENPIFHPGKCAAVYCNEVKIGVFGEIHPKTLEKFDFLENQVYIADFDLDALFKNLPDSFHSRPVSTFPPVLEDLAIIVPDEMPSKQVEDVIRSAGGSLLTNVTLFDVFKGEQIGSGKKSLAYNLTFQAFDRTLTDKNVEKAREKIIKALESQLQALVRRK
ncbi:MAG: phenylalanine--tRNA ligase subunit beta [Chloroflexi bacterium]|nr:phenylalanine--tRNA ligase subunit beta [Chloroflexota bacterium]